MEKLKCFHIAKVVNHPVSGWFVILDEFQLKTVPDRLFCLMDKSGNHDLIHESEIYKYTHYSTVKCNDSRDLTVLLKELSLMNDLKSQVLAIIETFKIVYGNGNIDP